MRENFFFWWGGVIEAARILQIWLYSPTKSSVFSKENPLFSYGCLSFLLVVFAKDICGGAVELAELFLIHKCLSAQQKTPACQNSVCDKNDAVSRPPNKDRPFKLNKFLSRHTHRQHRRVAWLSFLPRRSLKACAFTVSLHVVSHFWWRKRSWRWKAYLMFIAVLSWRALRVPRQY